MMRLLIGGSARAAEQVVVYTSEDQVFSEPVLKAFEAKTGITVKAVYDTEGTKSTGVVNRLTAERANPQANVFRSTDPVRPIVPQRKGVLTAYQSPNWERLPPQYRDADGCWTGFSARARVIVYDQQLVKSGDTLHSVLDLTAPAWKGQAALADPLFGTSTIHAAALFAVWGGGCAKAFFEQMRHNGVRVATSNGEVRDLVAAGEAAWGRSSCPTWWRCSRAVLIPGLPSS
jgi:iron(III) transport system substrate-binding protein